MTIINVPLEEAQAVQQADLTRSATRDIMLHMISNDTEVMDTPQWIKLKAKYTEEFGAFENAKSEIERKYIQPDFGNKNISWTLNYSTGELRIVEEEEEEEK